MAGRAGNLLKQDPRELQLYSSLKTAQQSVPDWPGSLPVPVLCTVGMQSAGKTTFIEALIGFRIGTTCVGTGTRCPVRYILKDGEPYFAVSRKKLEDRSMIQVAVERYMEGLALQPKEADRFSREELRVEITDRGLPLLDITDLPGLKAKGEGAEEIKSVVRFYVQSKSARPVVLVKATESVETQADVELLRDVGIDPNEGNATFVVNYFNDQLYKFAKVSELNEYCRGYAREYGAVFFCMLIYSQEAKDRKDRLDFDGQSTYYRELPVNERATFDQKVACLVPDEALSHEDVGGRFGVIPAIDKMQSIIRDFVIGEGRRYTDKIRPLEEQYAVELANLRKELSRCNPDYIKEQRERYVEKWVETVRDIQMCKQRLDGTTNSWTGLKPADCGLALEAELAGVCEHNGGVCLLGKRERSELEDLPGLLRQYQAKARDQDHLSKVASIGELHVGAQLTADASLVRLNDMFDFVVDKDITTEPVDGDEARCISGYAPGEMPGAFDSLQVVKEVATRPLARVREKLWPMLVHVRVIYEHPLEFAHVALKSHPGHTDNMEERVTESYSRLLQGRLRGQYESFWQIVLEKIRYLPAVVGERCSAVTRREDSRGLAAKWVGIHLFAAAGLLVFSHRLPADRWLEKRCMIGAGLGGLLRVQAGISVAQPSQAAKVDIAELNRAAEDHCRRLKAELTQQFRSKVARSLFDYLNQGILAEVREDLRQQIREVDAQQIDEETRARAADLRVRQADLEQSLGHIRRVLDDIETLNCHQD